MSEQELSPWGKEKLYNEKKLHKHEKKLRESLQEAQEEQDRALERLRRAEERMRKRMAEVQYLEERLNIVHQQMEALQAPHATVVTMIAASTEAFAPMIEAPTSSGESTSPLTDETSSEVPMEVEELLVTDETSSEAPMEIEELLVIDDAVVEPLFNGEPQDENQETSEVPVDDVVKQQAQEARTVAEAAEEAARVAIERVGDIEEYLEQVGSARHLMKELEHLQAEAEQATMIAREAEESARVAESLINSIRGEEQQENTMMSHVEDEEREEPIPEMNMNDSAQSSEPIRHPSPLEVAQVEEIEEEEENLETVAAMIIADAAGIAAAQAEAEAEASSARTREARALALKAEQALENVRAAIGKQKLSGEGAEIALRAAEREATHAHAVLADAEAAEERALNAAMNAEAEAEVAEGMAFAVSSRDERDEKLRDENASL